MVEFSKLGELYKHLETNTGDYKYSHQIGNLFQHIRDLKHDSGDSNVANRAQRELECFSFRIKNGKLKSMYTMTDENGHPVEWPDISNFSDEDLENVKGRLRDTTNPILSARYSTILWESPQKHAKYVKVAVDSYLKLVKYYEEKDKIEPKEHYGLKVLEVIENASSLAFMIKYKVEDIRSELIRLIREFNFDSSSSFVMRARLIKHMIEQKGNFPTECYDGLSIIVFDLANSFFKAGRFHNAITLFELCKKVENKLGHKTNDWNICIAESYEGLMNQRDESDLACLPFCQDAIDFYKKAKNKEKVKELEKHYEHLKGKQQYQEITQNVDLSEIRKECKKIADKLCDESPEKIITVLIADKSLLPRYKDMEARAENTNKVAILSKIAPVALSDQSGHIAEHFTTEDEKKIYDILQQYEWDIQFEKQFLIYEIFTTAIRRNKLNIFNLMEFFERNSWYGKNIQKKTSNNKTFTYNWLNLIAPGLNEYFNQLHTNTVNPDYNPNFVLAMDSLVLKIEGLIRDICIFSGITTFYQTKDKKNRIIVREKDINWLLREEPIKNLFDEDDLLFFKYVLVEKAGLNLRHKIAHCLINFSEYNITYIQLIILVLIKLGRYDFVKSDTIVEEKISESTE